jgi:hypothetical protein
MKVQTLPFSPNLTKQNKTMSLRIDFFFKLKSELKEKFTSRAEAAEKHFLSEGYSYVDVIAAIRQAEETEAKINLDKSEVHIILDTENFLGIVKTFLDMVGAEPGLAWRKIWPFSLFYK